MPANAVKTERDEHLWSRAKEQAKKQGRAGEYSYIMGIFQCMKGQKSMDAEKDHGSARYMTFEDLRKYSERRITKAEAIPGGLAAGRKPSDFDPKALADGVKVELEHTTDTTIAREIAMDHLAEDPKYYVKLRQVEKSVTPSLDDWLEKAQAAPSTTKPSRSRRKNPDMAATRPMVPHTHAQLSAKAPAGFSPIPRSKKGGFRKRSGNRWVYWYPGMGASEVSNAPSKEDRVSGGKNVRGGDLSSTSWKKTSKGYEMKVPDGRMAKLRKEGKGFVLNFDGQDHEMPGKRGSFDHAEGLLRELVQKGPEPGDVEVTPELKGLLKAALEEHGEAAVKKAMGVAAKGVAAELDRKFAERARGLASSPEVAAVGKTAAKALSLVHDDQNPPSEKAIRLVTKKVAQSPVIKQAAQTELEHMEGEIGDVLAEQAIKATGDKTAVKEPSKFKAVLKAVIKGGVGPFAFGFIDNFVLYLAGASIDKGLASMGFGAAAVAGLGNAVSDTVGQGVADKLESAFDKVGLGDSKTKGVLSEEQESKIKKISSMVGIFAGCVAGMVPMLFGVSFGKSRRDERDDMSITGPLDDWMFKAEQMSLFAKPKPKASPAPAKAAPKPSVAAKPPGAGWQPIPSGKHGGFRRRKGTKWEYWYAGEKKVSSSPRQEDVDPAEKAAMQRVAGEAVRRAKDHESASKNKEISPKQKEAHKEAQAAFQRVVAAADRAAYDPNHAEVALDLRMKATESAAKASNLQSAEEKQRFENQEWPRNINAHFWDDWIKEGNTSVVVSAAETTSKWAESAYDSVERHNPKNPAEAKAVGKLGDRLAHLSGEMAEVSAILRGAGGPIIYRDSAVFRREGLPRVIEKINETRALFEQATKAATQSRRDLYGSWMAAANEMRADRDDHKQGTKAWKALDEAAKSHEELARQYGSGERTQVSHGELFDQKEKAKKLHKQAMKRRVKKSMPEKSTMGAREVETTRFGAVTMTDQSDREIADLLEKSEGDQGITLGMNPRGHSSQLHRPDLRKGTIIEGEGGMPFPPEDREAHMRAQVAAECKHDDPPGQDGNGGLAEWWRDAERTHKTDDPNVLRGKIGFYKADDPPVVVEEDTHYNRHLNRMNTADGAANLNLLYNGREPERR